MYTNRGEKTKIHPPHLKKNTPTKKPKTKQNKKQKEKKKAHTFIFFQPAFHISIVKTNFKKIFKMYAG